MVFPATGVTNRSAHNDLPGGLALASLSVMDGGYTIDGNRIVLDDGSLKLANPNFPFGSPTPVPWTTLSLPIAVSATHLLAISATAGAQSLTALQGGGSVTIDPVDTSTDGHGYLAISSALSTFAGTIDSRAVELAWSGSGHPAITERGRWLDATGTAGVVTITSDPSRPNSFGGMAPGNQWTGPGTAAVDGLTMGDRATFQEEITGPSAGSGYGQVVVAAGGTVNLGDGAYPGSGPGVLLDCSGPDPGKQLVLLHHVGAGATNGSFYDIADGFPIRGAPDYRAPEGALVQACHHPYTVTYRGGVNRNDVVLTRVPRGGQQLMATNVDGRQEAFVLGSDGRVWHAWQGAVNGAWTQFYAIGGPVSGAFASDPAVGLNPDGRLEVFVTGSDGDVYHAWQQCAGCGWTPFYSLGQPSGAGLTGIPSVATNSDGRLELFAVAPDGAAWHAWQQTVGGGWTAWYRLGGPGAGTFVSAVAPGRNGDGRLEIAAVDINGALWHAWQVAPSGGWTSFYSLGSPGGTSVAGTPGEVTNADGRLEIVGRGADGHFWHIWQETPSGGWGGWFSLGGTLASDASVGRNGDGRLEAFATQADGSVSHVWQACPGCGWVGPYSLGTNGTTQVGTPQVGTDVNGVLEVLAEDATTNKMDQTRQVAPSSGWNNWAALNGTTLPPY
ncbi:MAG: hypothetical protein ABR598_03985 [Candidatus Dormibacteria bacterium]